VGDKISCDTPSSRSPFQHITEEAVSLEKENLKILIFVQLKNFYSREQLWVTLKYKS
jgi:hypothetical protein